MIARTGLLTVVFALGTACLYDIPEREAPPFPQTAFRDLEQTGATPGAGLITLSGDGRLLHVGTPWSLGSFTAGSTLTQVAWPAVAEGDGGRLRADEHLVYQARGEAGVDVLRTDDDGQSWQVVVHSAVAATWIGVADGRVLLTHAGQVAVVDRAAFRSRDTGDADVAIRVSVPGYAPDGVALLDGDVVWTSGSDGALAWDVADPSAPTLLYRAGDWFGGQMARHGDLLLIQTGYDGVILDVSDPRDPWLVDRLWGGHDVAVWGDHAYAIDRSTLYITDLRDPPTPVRFVELGAECGDVEVNAEAVYVQCGDELRSYGPNTP